ncbi:MAG: insulinase family protein [Bacteroidetes bacterium]|nr:MAG: insulinase family protein [Bacteroidota bacterium]
MIAFDKFTLDNGLKVIVHQDKTTPVVTVNILYNVGAKDETKDLTGFAHLFEHLMFGGSVNIPKYDEPLQKVGGENNAFTNNDITNYYLSIPKENIETAFWIESDRMLNLAFSEKSLEVQRNVVIEEFNQRYLNQPYGDLWLLLRPLVFRKHPYQWATIGKDISHIENAKMEDVKAFYKKYYNPDNAIMVVAGDVELEEIKQLSEKWFGPIERGSAFERSIPMEPKQTEPRFLQVERDVPVNAIFKVYHMCGRSEADYHTTDLISDIMANGKSSRLHQKLVKENPLFSSVQSFISGDIHPGMIVFAAYLSEGVSPNEANDALCNEIENLCHGGIKEDELQKVKNKVESVLTFSDINTLDRAMNLAYYELLGNAEKINLELEKYQYVKTSDIQRVANSLFIKDNSTTLFYLKK